MIMSKVKQNLIQTYLSAKYSEIIIQTTIRIRAPTKGDRSVSNRVKENNVKSIF